MSLWFRVGWSCGSAVVRWVGRWEGVASDQANSKVSPFPKFSVLEACCVCMCVQYIVWYAVILL